MRTRSLILFALGLAACGDGGTEPPQNGAINLQLNAGEVGVLEAPDIDEVTVEGAAGTYVFIPTNANATPDVVESYRVSFSQGTASPSAMLDVLTEGRAAVEPPFAVQHRFEHRLRSHERQRLDFAAGRRAHETGKIAARDVRADAVIGAQTVGEVVQIRVPDADASNLCEDFITVSATVKAVSTRAVVLQDNSAPSGGFTSADFLAIAAEFDNLIYPTGVQYFGNPSDLDQNAGRVLILYTPEVNKLTPPNTTGFVGGFFWQGDLFPRTAPDPDDACSQSNVGEIFYLLVPDPQGTINNNQRSASSVRQGTRGTIAHEFQHMINAGRRLTEGVATSFEAVWLDEALAHLAEDVTGRRLFGFSDFQNLTFQDVTSRGTDDFNAFFFQNLARFKFWQQRPDTSAATSSRAGEGLAYRGAAWALLRHTVDQHAGNDLPTFTRALVGGPGSSVANLVAHAGEPFDSLMTGWMVANFADDLPVAGLSPKYTYRSWNFRSASAGISGGTFPLRVTDLPNDLTQNLSLRSATGVYFRKAAAGGNASFTFRMQSGSGGTLNAVGARLYVIRVD